MTAHPGRGHSRSLPRPRRPPGHRRRRDAAARHCRLDSRWQRARPAHRADPRHQQCDWVARAGDRRGQSRTPHPHRPATGKCLPRSRSASTSSPTPPPTMAPKIIVAWAVAWVIDWYRNYRPVDRQLRRTHHARPDCRRRHRPTPALPRDGDRPARRTAVCAGVRRQRTDFSKDAWRRIETTRAACAAHLMRLGLNPCDAEQLIIDNIDADPASSKGHETQESDHPTAHRPTAGESSGPPAALRAPAKTARSRSYLRRILSTANENFAWDRPWPTSVPVGAVARRLLRRPIRSSWVGRSRSRATPRSVKGW